MKTKAIFLGLALTVFAAASDQDAIKLERKYVEGDKDIYAVQIELATAGGTAGFSFTDTRVIKKVYDNGDADIEDNMSDLKNSFNGIELPKDPNLANKPVPPQTLRYDKFGKAIKGDTPTPGPGMPGIELIRSLMATSSNPISPGKSYKLDEKDPKDPKYHLTGTAKLDSVKDGVASLSSDVEVVASSTGYKPAHFKSTAQFDVAKGRMTKVDGTGTGLVVNEMPIKTMKISLNRIG